MPSAEPVTQRRSADSQLKSAPPPLVTYARHLYRQRRKRDVAFGNLFAEPAWDMMLDLYISQSLGNLTAITSLCIAACVPPTTALRWVTKLVDDGIILRQVDPLDRRRSLAAFTPTAYESMRILLETAMAADPAFGLD